MGKLKGKVVSGIVLMLLLTSMLSSAFIIQSVKATGGIIYIRADGSVDPPSAPIQPVGNVYTFTDNIYDSIVIQRDNIVVDGASYTIEGIGAGRGIDLSYRSKVEIKNMKIKSFYEGIVLWHSNRSSISGNEITANEYGIYLQSSPHNSIIENNITANGNVGILGDFLNSIILSGNDIATNDIGIYLSVSRNSSVVRNRITLNEYSGIYLVSSWDNSIVGNDIRSNGIGIISDIPVESTYNEIYHNNFINNIEQVQWLYSDHASVWDDGYPSGGNYWSDYTGVDSNGDGIGDTPYVIDANNQDRYPFMNPRIPASPWSMELVADSYFNPTYPVGTQWTERSPSPNTRYRVVSWIDEQPADGRLSVSDHVGLIDLSNNQLTWWRVEAIIDGYTFWIMRLSSLQPTPKFNVGDRVRTTANLNVREDPGLSYTIIDTMPEGTLGQIMGGPVEADGYTWWDVGYDAGIRGWSAENWLETYTSPNNPPYIDYFSMTPDSAISLPDLISDYTNKRFPRDVDLSWGGWDPDGDSVTYDVYFGTSEIPPLVSSDQTATTYDPGLLSYGTTYYWRVIAEDSRGAIDTSPIKGFITVSGPGPVIEFALTKNTLTVAYVLDYGEYKQRYVVLDREELFIRNVGEGTLDWTVTSDVDWLHFSPDSGTSTTEWDTVTFDGDSGSDKEPGAYEGTIIISAPDATTRSVKVFLIVAELNVLARALNVKAMSPVDLLVTDPDNLVITKEFNGIPNAVYMEIDLNGDGSPDDYIFIPERKTGQYLVTVIPEPDADPTATYTLIVSTEDATLLLAEHIPVSEAPTEPYILDSTTFDLPPETLLTVGEPHNTGPMSSIYVSTTTPFTLTAEDNPGGTGVMFTSYRIYNTTYTTGWQAYAEPFHLTGLTDGIYSIDFNSTDHAGNIEATNTATVALDNTAPTINLTIGEPKYIAVMTYVTSVTQLTPYATDNDGVGVHSMAFKISNSTFDTGWQSYDTPFHLTQLTDGVYDIGIRSTDILGNVESSTVNVFLDNSVPTVTVTNPPAEWALQDGVTFIISTIDASGTSSMNISIREADGCEGIPVGFEDLLATYDAVTGKWTLFFDTLQLPDGYYVILVEAKDKLGNTGSTMVPYSIRNWAVLELLPATENNKAGRTMPVKFSLRVAASVDPNQPFVYNEDLTIQIYAKNNPSNILQTSTFGDTAKDYRIDTMKEVYITNFQTLKTPTTYVVEIYRQTMLIGTFEFKTVK